MRKSYVFKFADFYVELSTYFPRIYKMCEDYLCEEYPRIDFSIHTDRTDIIAEAELAKKEGINIRWGVPHEFTCVQRKISAELLSRDAFLMHGALIEYEGKGYLFTAKSGTGKTTHIKLWQRAFGEDKVNIVNGDKPIVRFIDGKVYAYGTPWCGKEGYNSNTGVELCGIAIVERADDNSIQAISPDVAIPSLFSQIMIADSADLTKQLELVDRLVEKVPMYCLKCNMNTDAALVAYNGMNPKK